MNRLRRVAIVTELIDRLRENGSWCGETHIQKATFFLQELLAVDLEYDFIMYRYGPFSFTLRSELTEMKADGLLDLRHAQPYGPIHFTTESSLAVRERFPKTLASVSGKISAVAERLGGKDVADLEGFATALFVWRNEDADSIEKISSAVQRHKPRLGEERAEAAARRFLKFVEDVRSIA